MAGKKQKIVKRVYEEGREKTIPEKKKPLAAGRDTRPSFEYKKQRFTARKTKPAPLAAISGGPAVNTFVDSCELPSHYGTTRLTLMVKDPFWIFAYWELAPDYLESLEDAISKEEIQDSKMVLRMYDVTLIDFNGHNANGWFDIEVGHHVRNWYINLWTDDVSYIGDLGLRAPDGRFFTLARSNQVHAPRLSYSPRTEQIWLNVTDEDEERPYVVATTEAGPARTAGAGAEKSPRQAAPQKKRRIYLLEEDIIDFYAKINPLLRDIISARLMKRHRKADYRFVLEGDTEKDKARILSMLPDKYFIKKIRTGASEEIILPGEKEEGHIPGSGGASEYLHEMRKRKFFFELGTELIVYGRTEPGADVWLKDKKIELRSDGTFSMRFHLPDGKLPLEFKAVSKDKIETKKINTYIDRHTKGDISP